MVSSGGRHVSDNLKLALELPSFLEALADIRGVYPDVQLDCEPWGHMDHSNGHCSCRSSDRTTAYVHELALMPRELVMPPSDGGGGVRRLVPLGLMSGRAWNPDCRWDVQDRCLLFLIGPELMAVFSWRCMCGGGLGCWCLLIGSGR